MCCMEVVDIIILPGNDVDVSLSKNLKRKKCHTVNTAAVNVDQTYGSLFSALIKKMSQ